HAGDGRTAARARLVRGAAARAPRVLTHGPAYRGCPPVGRTFTAARGGVRGTLRHSGRTGGSHVSEGGQVQRGGSSREQVDEDVETTASTTGEAETKDLLDDVDELL